MTACGSAPAAVSTPSSSASPSAAASPTPSNNPSPPAEVSPTPSQITKCPATVRNAAGHYTFTCSADWQYINCDAYSWLINPPGPCTQELYGARLVMISFTGAHDPPGYLGTLQSSKTVTVASVAGTRKVYLVTKTNPLPPSKDTVQVLYTFKTGGRTYYFEYDRYPGDTDSTADFDRMITQKVAFSA